MRNSLIKIIHRINSEFKSIGQHQYQDNLVTQRFPLTEEVLGTIPGTTNFGKEHLWIGSDLGVPGSVPEFLSLRWGL